MKIAHLTSAHSRYDSRIFLKECASLAANGHQVTLIVADGKGDERKIGIQIFDAGASLGRIDRIRHAPRRVFDKARTVDADIYHLHDPELLPIGVATEEMWEKGCV
jgi:hypothetical protein